MAERDKWQWQESGTAWRGVGAYRQARADHHGGGAEAGIPRGLDFR